MKRILSFALSFVIVLTISTTAFAAESTTPIAPSSETLQQENNTGEIVSSKTFELIPLSRKTFYGEAGSCTLDYLSEGYVRWSISVPGAGIVAFNGNLHFNKLNTPFGTFNHYISTTHTSGTEDVKYGLSKGSWEVTFDGVAVDAFGNKYAVVDNATLPFSVYW